MMTILLQEEESVGKALRQEIHAVGFRMIRVSSMLLLLLVVVIAEDWTLISPRPPEPSPGRSRRKTELGERENPASTVGNRVTLAGRMVCKCLASQRVVFVLSCL